MKQFDFSFPEDRSGWPWRALAWGALVVLIAWLKFQHHELWKDEWQAWLMARDMSWQELFGALYYEGHPAMWYVFLKLWMGIAGVVGGAEVSHIQVGHWLLVALFYALVVWRFQMPLWLKVLFLLGYYPLFEYGVVNRGYVLVELFAGLLALHLAAEGKHPAWGVLFFFLLCQTEVYGVLIAGALLLYAWQQIGWREAFGSRRFYSYVAGLVVGLLVFVISVYPRASQDELSSAYLSDPMSADRLAMAFQGTLVNTYWLGAIPDTNVFGVTALGLILSGMVLASLLVFFWKSRITFVSFLTFQVVFFLFASLIYTGGVRQWGNALILLFLLVELGGRHWVKLEWYRWLMLAAVLGFQLYYTGLAVEKELRLPFTNAKAAGTFIQEKVPEEVPIVAINKFEAAPVVGYAGRPFYALPDGLPFTYFKWVEKIYLPPEVELKQFIRYLNKRGLILISPKPLDQNRYPSAILWERFDAPTIKNERYYLYQLPL